MRGTSASPSLDCRNPSLLDKGRHHINAMTSGLEMPPFTDFLPLKFRLSIERVVILYYIVQFVVATWGPTYIPQLYLVILRAMPLIWFWYESPVSGWCSETPIKGLSLASLTSAKSALNYYVCRFVPISVQRFVDVRTKLYKLSYWLDCGILFKLCDLSIGFVLLQSRHQPTGYWFVMSTSGRNFRSFAIYVQCMAYRCSGKCMPIYEILQQPRLPVRMIYAQGVCLSKGFSFKWFVSLEEKETLKYLSDVPTNYSSSAFFDL